MRKVEFEESELHDVELLQGFKAEIDEEGDYLSIYSWGRITLNVRQTKEFGNWILKEIGKKEKSDEMIVSYQNISSGYVDCYLCEENRYIDELETFCLNNEPVCATCEKAYKKIFNIIYEE